LLQIDEVNPPLQMRRKLALTAGGAEASTYTKGLSIESRIVFTAPHTWGEKQREHSIYVLLHEPCRLRFVVVVLKVWEDPC
jgi:hypothetical protein